MMYYYKKPCYKLSIVEQDLSSHYKLLNFNNRLFGKPEEFNNLLTLTDINILADALASVMTEMYCEGYLDKKLILEGLMLCRDLVSSLGFNETNNYRLHEYWDGKPTVLLVAGCQVESMVRNRVVAARRLCELLPPPITIVFSGFHPPRERVKIKNESVRMENIFFEDVPEQKYNLFSKITKHTIEIEGASGHTEENIKKFIELGLIEKEPKVNVVLVTSTFHLPKLAEIFEDKIGKLSDHINTILLVGSEKLNRLDSTAKDEKYAKQVFFRLAFSLFKELKRRGSVEGQPVTLDKEV